MRPYMGVSKNHGTPQIIHLFIGCSIINHPFWGIPVFGNTLIRHTILSLNSTAGPKDLFAHNKAPKVEITRNVGTAGLAVLCDLFRMVKWPFKWLSDLQLGDEKVTLNHLGLDVFLGTLLMKQTLGFDRFFKYFEHDAEPSTLPGVYTQNPVSPLFPRFILWSYHVLFLQFFRNAPFNRPSRGVVTKRRESSKGSSIRPSEAVESKNPKTYAVQGRSTPIISI